MPKRKSSTTKMRIRVYAGHRMLGPGKIQLLKSVARGEGSVVAHVRRVCIYRYQNAVTTRQRRDMFIEHRQKKHQAPLEATCRRHHAQMTLQTELGLFSSLRGYRHVAPLALWIEQMRSDLNVTGTTRRLGL